MKIVAIIHMYPPIHNAGGETTVHALFRALVQRGHEVKVLCRPHSSDRQFEDYSFEGVDVYRVAERNDVAEMRSFIHRYEPDLLVTHLDLTFHAMQIAIDFDLPLVHVVHNSMQLKHHRVTPLRCQLAVFNSHWVAKREEWLGEQIVVHPVVEPDRYRCERGTKVTLVNPTPGKGEGTFYPLSRSMPDREFLCVKSVYGEQVFPPAIRAENYPNVEFMEHTPDIREVFRKTKVVLMPSLYESYGRVAVEAACAGIPAVVHPTEGLLESLGADKPDWIVNFTRQKIENEHKGQPTPTPDELKGGWISGAGIFCDRDDLDSWKAQVTRLLTDEVFYRSRVDAALKLAETLNPKAEYDRLEQALLVTTQSWENRNEVKEMKMWTNTTGFPIWETTDGRLVVGKDNRIPQDAKTLAVAVGGQIAEEVAMAHGLMPMTKAIDAPAENKAIETPEENKSVEAPKKTRTKKEAA